MCQDGTATSSIGHTQNDWWQPQWKNETATYPITSDEGIDFALLGLLRKVQIGQQEKWGYVYFNPIQSNLSNEQSW